MKATDLFGTTRTSVCPRHALIAPDGHVPSAFPGWDNATGFVMVSPEMGAGFSQILITFQAGGGKALFPADDHQHALYVESGPLEVRWDTGSAELSAGDCLYVPAAVTVELSGVAATRVTLFRKRYETTAGVDPPPVFHRSAGEVEAVAFLGNEKARLQVLLPDDGRFDMAMNLFTYQPGAMLPFVETHIMEHGLLMLAGQGIYRLEDRYYPVGAGDAIWMAPYCPQWFVAVGDEPAVYLYYKNINRLP